MVETVTSGKLGAMGQFSLLFKCPGELIASINELPRRACDGSFSRRPVFQRAGDVSAASAK
jgi:hypothetical protein